MFKRVSTVLFLLAFWWLSGVEATHAATIQLPRTGQTACYDTNGAAIACFGTGQDGDIKAGVAWPNPRFTDNGNGTVTDNLTSMVWTKDANLMKTRDPGFDNDLTYNVAHSTAGDGAVIWQHALDYIKKLNTENYLGYNDWRLPNINELRSLVDLQKHTPALPDGHPFTNLLSTSYWYYYWSSTTLAGYASDVRVVDMSNGEVLETGKILPYYVWPVRGGQWDETAAYTIPKTGQTTCSNYRGDAISCAGTGQDGELQKGGAWPSPRFADNSDNTVTDNLTGLNWTKNANNPGPAACAPDAVFYSWQGALDFIHCLNGNNFLGYNDWRLPNREELASLLDHQNNKPMLPDGHPFSNVGTGGSYWSSSTNVSWPYDVWFVTTDYGYLRQGFTKTDYANIYSVWPVRGGQTSPTVLDTAVPAITVFSIPQAVTSLTIPIVTFTATDNVAVTGYLITETSSKPSATATGWTTTAPTSYIVATAGSKTLYGWVKDAVGNVSNSVSAGVTVTLPDVTVPVVNIFTIPATATSLTVPVTAFSATDNTAVTGYLLTEASTKPSATATGWTATAPTSYTFATAGSKTLYAWAKDAAGNVSGSSRAGVMVTLPATTLKGDVNGDGKVDITDALLTLQYALNLIPHNASNDAKYLVAADVAPVDSTTLKPKGDGKVDVMDALVILQRAVNLLSW